MLKKPYLRSKICNINFWIGNDPPPFGTFPKIHPFWRRHPSLTAEFRLNSTCVTRGLPLVLFVHGILLTTRQSEFFLLLLCGEWAGTAWPATNVEEKRGETVEWSSITSFLFNMVLSSSHPAAALPLFLFLFLLPFSCPEDPPPLLFSFCLFVQITDKSCALPTRKIYPWSGQKERVPCVCANCIHFAFDATSWENSSAFWILFLRNVSQRSAWYPCSHWLFQSSVIENRRS